MTAELTEGTASRLLGRLDQLLRAAVERMLATLGPDTAADPFRGLYISRDDAARLRCVAWAAFDRGQPGKWRRPGRGRCPGRGRQA